MSELTTEHLHGSYWKGEFADLTLVVDIKTGCFNAAKLCQLKGKRIGDWMALLSTGELIEEVCTMLKIPAYVINDVGKKIMNPEIRCVVKGGDHRETWGTYLHIRFLVPLAQWICAKYAIHVSTVMLEIHAKENAAKQAALVTKVTKQRGKISTLTDKVQTLIDEGRAARKIAARESAAAEKRAQKAEKRWKESERKADTLLRMGQNQLDKIDHQTNNISSLNDNVDTLHRTLGAVTDARVVNTSKESDENILVILWLYSMNQNHLFDYHVFRINKNSLSSSMSRLRDTYSDAEIAFDILYTPNAIVLWKLYLETYQPEIVMNGNSFYFTGNYDITDMIRDLREIHEYRKDTSMFA